MEQIENKQLNKDGVLHLKNSMWARLFVLSVSVIFFITGLAKIVSADGKAEILNQLDPIFQITFRQLMLCAGISELAVSVIFLFIWKRNVCLPLIAWIATTFLMYRMGLWWMGWSRPCKCLGNLTDALQISPDAVDWIAKILLGYLLVGSYTAIFWFWMQKRIDAKTATVRNI